MVGTGEAGKILGICPRRLRYLLAAGRVRGAFNDSCGIPHGSKAKGDG